MTNIIHLNNQIKKLLGHVGVDSGMIIIGDPCYFQSEINYQKIIKKIEDKVFVSMPFTLGHEGAGVVSRTHCGDGEFPVYGYFYPNEDRPFKLEVVFDESC